MVGFNNNPEPDGTFPVPPEGAEVLTRGVMPCERLSLVFDAIFSVRLMPCVASALWSERVRAFVSSPGYVMLNIPTLAKQP